jgi:hypothetical protein
MKHQALESASSRKWVDDLRLATTQVLCTSKTVWILVMTAVVCAPLYLAGYHHGLRPVAGFALSLLLGAVLLAVAIAWSGRERPRAREVLPAVVLVLRHVGVPLAAFSILVAGAAWGWNDSWGSVMPKPLVELVTNTASSINKPFVHVVLGSVLAFIASPAVFLGIAAAAPGQPLQAAVDARPETPSRSVLPTAGLLGLWGAWLLLAHVPVLGWLLVPVLAGAIRRHAGGGPPSP